MKEHQINLENIYNESYNRADGQQLRLLACLGQEIPIKQEKVVGITLIGCAHWIDHCELITTIDENDIEEKHDLFFPEWTTVSKTFFPEMRKCEVEKYTSYHLTFGRIFLYRCHVKIPQTDLSAIRLPMNENIKIFALKVHEKNSLLPN